MVLDVPVVRDFANVFPEDVPGVPLVRQVEFRYNLILDASLITKVFYCLTPLEMHVR